ncbi:MAG: hypothetical protein B7Z44_06535 [Caulobacter sp. 12-67-6]|nr:MAG: hypothetical protein B7Z44_06535 [Caulobacter sp. 12-67-6]OYX70528.1 MAG: hypothetical protein B7Y81_11215 [Caulobacter sp. 32-67-35]OYX96700.1 MAG: hypothetical protein B7Y78_03280 [Caulobacter sp. 35-67-4]
MKRYLYGYLATGGAFLVLDMIWLTFSASRLYRPVIGEIMADTVNLAPAVAFYLIYLTGVFVLAILPAAEANSWKRLLIHAAVFGFCAYATYDLTNQATLKVWSTTITLIDLAWGTFVTTAAASIGFWVMRSVR